MPVSYHSSVIFGKVTSTRLQESLLMARHFDVRRSTKSSEAISAITLPRTMTDRYSVARDLSPVGYLHGRDIDGCGRSAERVAVARPRTWKSRFKANAWLGVIVSAIILPLSPLAVADEEDCGTVSAPSKGGSGPWDYFDQSNQVPTGEAPQGRLKLVEHAHYYRNWELINPKWSSRTIAGELLYVLKMLPNHPRALWAASRLEKARGPMRNYAFDEGIPFLSADCLFDRALRFRSDVPNIWMIYGMHLHSKGKLTEAKEAYGTAEKLGATDAQFHYNYALLLIETKNLDEAVTHADNAYKQGHPSQGLKNQLKRLGRNIDFPSPGAAK
jgi:hypothetical protein